MKRGVLVVGARDYRLGGRRGAETRVVYRHCLVGQVHSTLDSNRQEPSDPRKNLAAETYHLTHFFVAFILAHPLNRGALRLCYDGSEIRKDAFSLLRERRVIAKELGIAGEAFRSSQDGADARNNTGNRGLEMGYPVRPNSSVEKCQCVEQGCH